MIRRRSPLRALPLLIALGAAACGKKAPPERPLEPALPVPKGLAVRQRGADLRLSWSLVRPHGDRYETEVAECAVSALRLPVDPALDWDADRKRIVEAVGRGEMREVGRVPIGRRTDSLGPETVYFLDADAATDGQESVYRIVARTNAKNRGSASEVLWVRTVPAPPRPASLTAAPSPEEIRLTIAPGEGTPPGALFQLYRQGGVPGPGEPGYADPWDPLSLAAFGTPEGRDATASLGRDYIYRAAAFVRTADSVRILLEDREGPVGPLEALAFRSAPHPPPPRSLDTESPLSDPIRIAYRDTFAPATPVGLRALVEGSKAVLLWEPSDEPDFAGYRVYRRDGEDGEFHPIGGLRNEAAFRDETTEPGKSYAYRVSAVDRADPPNESAPTEPAPVIVPPR